MSLNNPERSRSNQESDGNGDNRRRSSASSTDFNVLRDATGSADTIPKEGTLRSVKNFFSDFFSKSRRERYDLIAEQKETKQEILRQYIDQYVSTYTDPCDLRSSGPGFSLALLELRKKKGLDIHRKDIVQALSTYIKEKVELLKGQPVGWEGNQDTIDLYLNKREEIEKKALQKGKDKEQQLDLLAAGVLKLYQIEKDHPVPSQPKSPSDDES